MVTITIETESAEFDAQRAGTEVSRILRGLAEQFGERPFGDLDGQALVDANGNTVGTVEVS